jgi:hypothetical protein
MDFKMLIHKLMDCCVRLNNDMDCKVLLLRTNVLLGFIL